MRKKYFTVCLLLMIFSFCLASGALAAPVADLTMHIADLEQIDGGVEFNVVIDIGKPSDPYASLDFNIVSSSEEHLSIVDLSEAGDKSRLAVDFSPDYGGAYHKGRIDETDGSVSYLVGIFSRNSGNNITDETNICTVRFRYTGSLDQELLLENIKLIYKNSDGEITSTPLEKNVSQSVSLTELVQIDDGLTPLSGDVMSLSESGASPSVVVYMLIASAALIVALILIWRWQRVKRKSA